MNRRHIKQFCSHIKSDLRDKLIKMSLINVNRYGWTQSSIQLAANELGYSNSLASIVSPDDLVYFTMDNWNHKLKSELKQIQTDQSLAIDDKVKKALKLRLSYEVPYINTWHQAIKIGLKRNNIPTTWTRLFALSDDVCSLYEEKDIERSSELNVSPNRILYSKTRRLIILKIFLLAEMNLMTDRSFNNKDTFTLIDQLYNVNIALYNTLNRIDMINASVLSMIKYSLSSLIPYDYSKVDEMLEAKNKLEEVDLKL